MVFNPSAGADEAIFFFRIINIISCWLFPSNDILTVILIQMHCWPCHKLGPGHHRVMIYIYIVVLEPSMLQAMFRWNRSTGSGEDFWEIFTIYGPGSHLGHVTWIIYIHISYPILYMLHIKFGFDWPSGFRGADVWILWRYTCILPGGGGIWAPVVHFLSESLIVSPIAHFLQDFHFKWHFKSFPHSNALVTYVDLAIK